MDPKIVLSIVVLIVALLVIVWAIARRRRTGTLRQQFGPEYDRTVRVHGPGRGESVLLDRKERVNKLEIRALGAAERERFISRWRTLQSQFVEDPNRTVGDADRLVKQVMEARGYPMSNFDQRAADISVDYPRVVDNYRAAHEIALREGRGEATTEDLRKAVIYYRSLFSELLETRPPDEHDIRRREVA